MKRFGPPMIDRRLKRRQSRSDEERAALEDEMSATGDTAIELSRLTQKAVDIVEELANVVERVEAGQLDLRKLTEAQRLLDTAPVPMDAADDMWVRRLAAEFTVEELSDTVERLWRLNEAAGACWRPSICCAAVLAELALEALAQASDELMEVPVRGSECAEVGHDPGQGDYYSRPRCRRCGEIVE